jgi:hypothetical protein
MNIFTPVSSIYLRLTDFRVFFNRLSDPSEQEANHDTNQ